jgi:hypothetical protein
VDDIGAAIGYRQQAQALRARADQAAKRPGRNADLKLADEYDWRAASIEAALVFRTGRVELIPVPQAAE